MDDHCDFEGRSTARALLSSGNAGMLPLQIDLRRHGVSAHRAMRQAMRVILGQSFHFSTPLKSSDASE
jgi:hypothetical protein